MKLHVSIFGLAVSGLAITAALAQAPATTRPEGAALQISEAGQGLTGKQSSRADY